MMNSRGFTLIEIMVTLAVSLIMILTIYGVIHVSQRSSSGLERKVAAQQDEKAALELMAMEIRMASYNPTLTPDAQLWLTPTTCRAGDFSVNPTYKGIQEATPNSITVEMDITNTANNPIEDGIIGSGASNEIIRYNYDTTTANRLITRSTSCGPAMPFLGATGGTTVVKTVNVINDTLGIPVFRYFDGNGGEISATVVSNPAHSTLGIPAIRRIEIVLAVETESPDPNLRQRRRTIYSTSVIVRNHAPGL
jgi:prepilin-type N-terminal cleavage/methylation domain-containing protein